MTHRAIRVPPSAELPSAPRAFAALALAFALTLLAGCAFGPGAERFSEPAPVEPLTAGQEAALAEAREAWAENRLAAAQSQLDALLAERPRQPDLLANAALVALGLDKPDEAVRLYRAALEAEPGHPMASNNLALLLQEDGQFSEARRLLEAALEKYPDAATLHYNLGVLNELYLMNLEQALAHYQRYQDLAANPDPQVALWITDLERRVE